MDSKGMDGSNYEYDWDYAGVVSGVLASLTVDFEPLMTERGAVWCPFCPRYLVILVVLPLHFELHFEQFYHL